MEVQSGDVSAEVMVILKRTERLTLVTVSAGTTVVNENKDDKVDFLI